MVPLETMPYLHDIDSWFLADDALGHIRSRKSPLSKTPCVFYFFFLEDSELKVCDGLSTVRVSPAILSHFVPLLKDLIIKNGRGAIISHLTPINPDPASRLVLLTDTQHLRASIVRLDLAQSLTARVNYPHHAAE